MKTFHIAIQAYPKRSMHGPVVTVDGIDVPTITCGPEDVPPMDASFEAVYERLETLERMFIEQDGSFTWGTVLEAADAWRIDGNLYDRDGKVIYIEVKGSCPLADWQRFVTAVNPPDSPLMIQWLSTGVRTPESAFRGWLSA